MPLSRLAGATLVLFLVCPSVEAVCTFGALTPTRHAAGENAGDIVAGRFNGDSFVDLAIVNRGKLTISILLGTAGGGFTPGTAIPVEETWEDLMAGDITGDGKTDLAVSIRWGQDFTVRPYVKTLRGNGDGTFTPVAYDEQMAIWQNPNRLAPGDFNNDGRMDAVVTKSDGELSALTSIGRFLVQKAEYTTLEQGDAGGWATSIVSGDFDEDGKLDVAVSEFVHQRVVPFYGVGDGTFVKGTAIPVEMNDLDDKPWSLGAGDVDGDGDADLAIGLSDETGGPDFPDVLLSKSNGAGRTFSTPATIIPALTSRIDRLILHDMDADGDLDLVVGTPWSMHVYLGDGSGAFPTHVDVPDNEALGMTLADIDRDGGPDIVSTSFTAGQAIVALNTCGRVTLNLTSSANPANQGSNLTVTATVVNPATAVATGTLTLSRNTTTLATGSLSSATNISSTTKDLVPGTYEYRATYSGDSRFSPATATLLQKVQTPPFGPPPGLVATSFGGAVQLSWIAPNDVHHYEIWRSSGGAYAKVGESFSASFADPAPAAGTFLYKVRAVSGAGVHSEFSAVDLATTRIFTEETLVAQTTTVKAAHLTELRAAVDAARVVAGLPPATFTTMDRVRGAHITELRTAAAEVRAFLGLTAVAFTDGSLTAGASIRASHVLELRAAIR